MRWIMLDYGVASGGDVFGIAVVRMARQSVQQSVRSERSSVTPENACGTDRAPVGPMLRRATL